MCSGPHILEICCLILSLNQFATFPNPEFESSSVPVFLTITFGTIDGFIFSDINMTEDGVYLDNETVWTGTSELGKRAFETCNNWTDDTAFFKATSGTVNQCKFKRLDLTW